MALLSLAHAAAGAASISVSALAVTFLWPASPHDSFAGQPYPAQHEAKQMSPVGPYGKPHGGIDSSAQGKTEDYSYHKTERSKPHDLLNHWQYTSVDMTKMDGHGEKSDYKPEKSSPKGDKDDHKPTSMSPYMPSGCR